MLIKESHKNSYEFFITLFIKLLGFIFLFAFIDSFFQYKSLIGANGYAPVTSFLHEAQIQFGAAAIWKFPSLFWIYASDNFICIIFIIGIIASLAVLLGRFISVSLFLTVVCWLSILNNGSDFFLYIWDTLLLEAGFISFLISFLYRNEKYKGLVLFVLWFFAFRLWFSMGIVTILYNNSVALNGEFIKYFFQNQPMPSKLAFYAYHLPPIVHSLISTILVIIEIVVPFTIIHKKTRGIAFYIFFTFSMLIFLVGNYAWFNPLSMIISIPLLIDTKQGERIHDKLKKYKITTLRLVSFNLFELIVPTIYFQITLQMLLLIFMFTPLGNRYLNFLNYYNYNPGFLEWENKNYFNKILSLPIQLGSNFKLANPYGVFKGIPVKRWEIEFEVCNDTIKGPFKKIPYFYKPGYNSGFSFFAPHHPRFEQQLFYEAQQGNFTSNYTPYQNKLYNLCWTRNYVKQLLKSNTFFNHATYNNVKISIVQLNFNTLKAYRINGNVWEKETVFSYFVSDKMFNCSLINNDDFITYSKHIVK